MNKIPEPTATKATAEEYSTAALELARLWSEAGHTAEELGEALTIYTREALKHRDTKTGLDFLRTAPADEIAEVLASGHPPVGVVHCDVVSCRSCWLHWLTQGGAIPCTCGKEAKA